MNKLYLFIAGFFAGALFGVVIGVVIAPFVSQKAAIAKPPVFDGQQLSIPDSKVLRLSDKYIVIEDAKGKQASFNLSSQFRSIDVPKSNDSQKLGGNEPVSPGVLRPGDTGTLLLIMSGEQYQAFIFYLVNKQ